MNKPFNPYPEFSEAEWTQVMSAYPDDFEPRLIFRGIVAGVSISAVLWAGIYAFGRLIAQSIGWL